MKPANGVKFKPVTLVLLSVAAVFQNEETHTKNFLARDELRRPVSPYFSEAVCFCFDAALLACEKDLGFRNSVNKECWNALDAGAGILNVISFNDSASTTPAMVVDACYRAAEYAEYGMVLA